MISWIVILFYYLRQTEASAEAHYECGPHGKFEYCVDEAPGCVVGCHCHPGYYFDTDTKICEPNIKLTQFRRQYDLEPTRISRTELETVPTPTTTTNPIDDKFDAIAKDTDDLGDWLYNQFFKTIENQVINNTDGEPKTRRSGGAELPPKGQRRMRKKSKKSGRKKSKKKGLKHKLLRITEDDSLFDSSSSDSDSSSSDESESTNDSSGDTSNDHDHRKIIMINKKPSVPLPSFIFLPNVETPFYPPIGIPAPPIIPMYPMVPVPPMGMPMPGFPSATVVTTTPIIYPTAPEPSAAEPPISEQPIPPPPTFRPSTLISHQSSTHKPSTSNEPTYKPQTSHEPTLNPPTSGQTSMEPPISKIPTKKPPVTDDTINEELTTDKEMTLSPNDAIEEKDLPPEDGPSRLRFSRPRFKGFKSNNRHTQNKNGHRNRLIQKMRGKMKGKNKPPLFEDVMDPIQNYETPYMQLPEQNPEIQENSFNDVPLLEDVDFKYLSQLIHKIDLNDTVPNLSRNQVTNGIADIPPVFRRNNYPNTIPGSFFRYLQRNRPVSKADELKDTYYSNLGKQIASLIRKIDNNDTENQINGEIEQQSQDDHTLSIFNENRFAPRSYWERFVRSPLKFFKSSLEKAIGMKPHSEPLENMENQVQRAANYESLMNLQELENIVNLIKKSHTTKPTYREPLRHIDKNLKKTNRLNINLLPQVVNKSPWTGLLTVNELKPIKKHKNPDFPGYIVQSKSIVQRTPIRSTQVKISQINVTNTVVDMTKVNSLQNLLNAQRPTLLQEQISKVVHKNITNERPLTAQQIMKYQVNPIMLNYKNINYVNNNHNRYHVQRSFLPIQIPDFIRDHKPSHTKIRPSYFHHSLHNFDYFEN